MGLARGKSRWKAVLNMESLGQERLVNIREASQILCVSASTLYGWVWQRRIPFVKVGRSLRFNLADLRKFIDANRVEARTSRVG
jgi:excisionase family DNA binding protein